VAQGSDGGGSIRIPSSFCGIYGIKGTQGRIPRRHAGLSSWHPVNFSCMGPMSRYVIDSAIMMQVMAGPHPEAEPGTIQAAPPDFISNIEKGISGKKIAWSQDFGCRPMHPDVKTNTQNAVKVFEELGAKVEPFDFTFNLDDLEEPIMKVLGFASRYASGGDELLKKDPDAFMPHVYNTILRGKEVRSDDYVRALARLYEYRAYVESIFEEYDFISAPTMAIPANKINERAFFENGKVVSLPWNDEIKFQSNDLDFSSWNYVYHAMTSLFNWSGNPAATLPCGFSTDGLPIGLQIVGKKENEVGVLQASRAFEIARPWHENKPNI
jgi:aspartyl-tRNA(Asn)/glutamyl-tRNA(Gln) amidotransferase subunit A